MAIKFDHDDHGLPAVALLEVGAHIGAMKANGQTGFYVTTVKTSVDVPSALWGPDAGDPPIEEIDVSYVSRGDRPWKDRTVEMWDRPSREVQVVLFISEEGVEVFTAYGGPRAPQHPEDPSNADPEGARAWWAEHALNTKRGQ